MLLVRNAQVAHADLASGLRLPDLAGYLAQAARQVAPIGSVSSLLNIEVSRQALMVAYINDFWLSMWTGIIFLPLLLLLRPAKGKQNRAHRELPEL